MNILKPKYLAVGLVALVLLFCCGRCATKDASSNTPSTIVELPEPTETVEIQVTKKQVKPKTTVRKKVYYENCNAVRAAGKDPLRRGQPGYSAKLDRNSDGVACERS